MDVALALDRPSGDGIAAARACLTPLGPRRTSVLRPLGAAALAALAAVFAAGAVIFGPEPVHAGRQAAAASSPPQVARMNHIDGR